MRAFRSKSLSLRGKKDNGANEALPDLASIIPNYAQRVQQQALQQQQDLAALASAGSQSRPLTPLGPTRPAQNRGSFSRPWTASTPTRRNLVVNSLRRHNIDPDQSCLVDDDCIGMALGSPTQSSFHTAAASPVVATVRSEDLDQKLVPNPQSQQAKSESSPKSRPSAWRTMSVLFGRKRQTAGQSPRSLANDIHEFESEPEPGPEATIDSQNESSLHDNVDAPRFSSHFSRRRKSEAGHKPRKSLTLRRKPKIDLEQDQAPALPTEKFTAFESHSLQHIDIPSSTLDRFSVMFAPVLQGQTQSNTLHNIQQSTKDYQFPLLDSPSHRLSSLLPAEMVSAADMPPVYVSPSDTTSSPHSHNHHQRSATAPGTLDSSLQTASAPDRTPPPPPLPTSFHHLYLNNRARSPSVVSDLSVSTASLIRSPASSIMTDLENYYLPPRYEPGSLNDDDDAMTRSSSRSSRTFSMHYDRKPEVPHGFSRSPSPALSATPPEPSDDHEDDDIGSNLTRQLTSTSLQSSTYLSARAYPSSTSSLYGFRSTAASPTPSFYQQHQQQQQQQHLYVGQQPNRYTTASPIDPYSPSAAFGYNDPHSPLLELARSNAVQQPAVRPRMVQPVSSSSLQEPSAAATTTKSAPLLNQGRCGTPQLVQQAGSGRRVSAQVLLDY